MKIGQPSELPALVTQAKTSASPKADANATAAAANQASTASSSARSAGVSVTVSTAARALEKTERSAGAEVDAEKVSAVRTAIQQGTYVVNAEAIADKLLSNAQEMLRRTTN